LLLRKADRMTMTGDVTIALNIPLLPFVYVIAALFALTSLIHALKCVAIFTGNRALVRSHSDAAGPSV
jgi:hypothetical protein